MALGGGIWAVQNKVLPGTYINFSSVAKASATLSDRGYAAMPLMLDWGPDSTVFTVTSGDFQKNSLKIFGHAYTDDALLPLRELFQYTQTLYAYRLNGGGAKADCAYCTAKYSGIAGNKLYVVIAANADNADLFDVSLYYDTTLLDTQTVAAATALKDNDFVTWKTTASLTATAKTPLTGGTNGTANAAAHQAALDKFESYSFNTLGCPSDDSTTIKLYINYTKRLRDEVGAKFQTVIFNLDSNEKLADYEGVIEIGSKATDYDSGISGLGQYGLVYWMTGASAGCAVNKSNTNKKYDGELTVDVDRTQAELEAAIKAGRLMFHNVNGDVRILEDIESLITVSEGRRLQVESDYPRLRPDCERYGGPLQHALPRHRAERCGGQNRSLERYLQAPSGPRVYSRYRGLRPRQRNRRAGRHEEGCPLHCEGPERRERYGSALYERYHHVRRFELWLSLL